MSNLSFWKRWRPTEDQPWNLRRVVHLHRRVGFAASWDTLQRDLRDGPDAAIDRLLNPDLQNAVAREFTQMADVIGEAAVGSGNANRLKAWWLYRMLVTPDPLGERLALMWHNHFATSNLKVDNLDLMRRQNELFRKHGRASFSELFPFVVKDPALLVWLDADANRKEHPNENLARESMELFALGVGNYTEPDIREAARALTGWSVKDGLFRQFDQFHDDGTKTLFGKTGQWNGDDLVRMLIEHPATAKRISHRLCETFMGEGVVDNAAHEELATDMRDHNLRISHGVETIVRSELFFSERNIGNRVLSPVEFIVNVFRALELLSPPPSTLLLAEWATALGQNLFYPPNVFGWPGGRSWLTTRSVIGRSNFVTALFDGTVFKPGRPLGVETLAMRHGFEVSRLPEFLGQLLFGLDASSKVVKQQARIGVSSSDVAFAILTWANANLD